MTKILRAIGLGIIYGIYIAAGIILLGTLGYAFYKIFVYGGVIAYILGGCFLVGIVYASVQEYLSDNISERAAKNISIEKEE